MPKEVTKHVPHYKMKGPSIWESLGVNKIFAPAKEPRQQPRTLPQGWGEGNLQSGPGIWERLTGFMSRAGNTMGQGAANSNPAGSYGKNLSLPTSAPLEAFEEDDVFAEEQDPRDAANDARLASIGGYKREAAPVLKNTAPKRKPSLITGAKRQASGFTPPTIGPVTSGVDNLSFEEPTSEYLDRFEPEANSGRESDSSLYVNEGSPALDRYLDHISQMPNYNKPSIWNRIGGAFVGAMEGGRNGAGAGFQAGRAALNAPYEEAVNRWGMQGNALKEAASLEAGSMAQYLKNMNIQSQMEARERAAEQGDRRLAIGEMNANSRAQSVALRERDMVQRGYRLVPNSITGELMFVHPTQEPVPTGLTSMEYARYKQQQAYQGGMLRQGDARIRGANEGRAQGWSRMEESKYRDRRDNEGQ